MDPSNSSERDQDLNPCPSSSPRAVSNGDSVTSESMEDTGDHSPASSYHSTQWPESTRHGDHVGDDDFTFPGDTDLCLLQGRQQEQDTWTDEDHLGARKEDVREDGGDLRDFSTSSLAENYRQHEEDKSTSASGDVRRDVGAFSDSSMSQADACYHHEEDEAQYASGGADDKVCAVSPNLRGNLTPDIRLCNLCDDVTISAVGHCSDCDEDLCSACVHRHSKMRMAAQHHVTLFRHQQRGEDVAVPVSASRRRLSPASSTMSVVDRCHKHKEEKLRFFCKTCQKPVCRDCILTLHKQHLTEDIGDATLTARKELANMMTQLEQKRTLLETFLHSFRDYRTTFEEHVQRVEDMMNIFYAEVKTAVEQSYHTVAEELEECRRSELERIHNQELLVQNNIEDVTRLLGQQASNIESSILVLSQHEVVSHALQTLDQNILQVKLGQGEFFISKNPKLTAIPEHFLGRVTFMTCTPSRAQPEEHLEGGTVIREVMLRRELAFNIWEANRSKSSIRSIVDTSSGMVWVATSRSLLKVTDKVSRENINVPDDIAGMAAGPGDKLLVSLGQGSSIKVYANNNWSAFASVPKGNTVMASRVRHNGLQVYVAVTSQLSTTKILSYSTDGQVCQQIKLPAEIFQETLPSQAASSSSYYSADDQKGQQIRQPAQIFQEISFNQVPCTSTLSSSPSSKSPSSSSLPSLPFSPLPSFPSSYFSFPSSTSSTSQNPSSTMTSSATPSLQVSCMAVGGDGSLCLGDEGGSRLLMLDSMGQLKGQYLGPDGRSGCHPHSVCVLGPAQVILADSHNSRVDLISTEGRLLASLLTRDQLQHCGLPTAVTLDGKGRLWVGTSMGHVGYTC